MFFHLDFDETRHSRDPIAAVEVHDQAREDVDVAAGDGKGVELRVQDDPGAKGEGLGRDGLDQTAHEALHIVADFRVLHQRQVGADHGVELLPHLLLILEGDPSEKEGMGLSDGKLPRQQGEEGHPKSLYAAGYDGSHGPSFQVKDEVGMPLQARSHCCPCGVSRTSTPRAASSSRRLSERAKSLLRRASARRAMRSSTRAVSRSLRRAF